MIPCIQQSRQNLRVRQWADTRIDDLPLNQKAAPHSLRFLPQDTDAICRSGDWLRSDGRREKLADGQRRCRGDRRDVRGEIFIARLFLFSLFIGQSAVFL